MGIALAMLAISFTIAAFSLSQNAIAANLSSPTPTLTSTPISSSAAISSLTASPEPTNSVNGTTVQFGYGGIGEECSSLPTANTITLCNCTTPPNCGIITQISIYLAGIPEGSSVSAVIFANEPEANFPQGGEPIAQSFETLNVSSVSGQWYNFTMNYSASPNTLYWFGYYSDNITHYFFDTSNNTITVTSQPENGISIQLPVVWYYQGKAIMSLYALYTPVTSNSSQPQPTATPTPSASQPQPSATPTPSHLDSAIHESILSCWDTLFVLSIIGAETAVVVAHQIRKRAIPEGDKKD